ncbi:hypothetical protein ACE7GA_10785 [Roseomonas sp. CCTCC AB2023176]|uniref:hypothetical protein n=1 Tax=Roseomonas sp. CCTCC AB2023176 TaxID=3342640 RepID=UPI0035DDC16D
MAAFEVLTAIKEGVDTIKTIKGWFDGPDTSFSTTAAQIEARLNTIEDQIDNLTELAKNILTATNQASAQIRGAEVRAAYNFASTAIDNIESYRLSGSQGDLDNARNNSIQALNAINNVAATYPEQTDLLIGPLFYILGVRIRVGRELDDGAFAAPAYSTAIQNAVNAATAFASRVEATLTRDVPRVTTRTFTDYDFRPPIITTTTGWSYVNDTGTFAVSYGESVERQAGRVLSRTVEGGYTERLGTDGPIVRTGSYSGSPASAEAEGYALDRKYLGLTDLRAEIAAFDALNNGIYVTGGDGAENVVGAGGRDALFGGGGDDTVTGAAGQDALRGEGGNDLLNGGTEADVLRGGDGDDTLLGGTGDDTIDGGAGTDRVSFADGTTGVSVFLALTVAQDTGRGIDVIRNVENATGSEGADRLTGNALGNDLVGLGGSDTLDGGDGNDTLTGGAGNDLLTGGVGRDLVRFGVGGAGVTVDLGTGIATGRAGSLEGTDTLSGIEDVVGSAFADLIRGDANANRLEGAGGADTLEGSAGADTLLGEGAGIPDAADRISGGDGDDRIEGLAAGGAQDTLDGGTGRDTYVVAALGTGVADLILDFQTGAGGDVLDLSVLGPLDAGDAFASGRLRLLQSGEATTELQVDTDTGPGRAYASLVILQGVRAADLQAVNFSPSAGFAQGGWPIIGTPGQDGRFGSDYGELISGLGGDDLIVGLGGNDTLDGGEGTDTTSYALAGAGVVVDLAAGSATGGAGTDVLTGIENVAGSTFADTLRGNDAANVLNGGSGRNALAGRDGDDWLIAGDEGDSLSGDDRNDTLTGGAGDDTLEGGAGDDVVQGNAGTDRAEYAGAAAGVAVSLLLSGPQDTRGAGMDALSGIEALGGSAFRDRLTGDAGANTLDGRGSNDVLAGGLGNDALRGGDGADALNGGGGSDTLEGGTGADRLIGGGGRDLFVFGPGSGADVILDYAPGVDRLDLRTYGVDTLAEALAAAADVGPDLRLDLAGASILLLGVQELELTARDFVFR